MRLDLFHLADLLSPEPEQELAELAARLDKLHAFLDRLEKLPAFLAGVGSVLNLGPSRAYDLYPLDVLGRETTWSGGFEEDARNLAKDWRQVGSDLHSAATQLPLGRSVCA